MDRLTDLPFPSYTYVPGKSPHPIRELDGHSYGQPEPHVERFDPAQWRDCREYLFGVDLFNAKFYWESHEQWEAVWHCVGRKGTIADLLKGLIKLSAAGVKLFEERPAGVERHARRAEELFGFVRQTSPQLCGFDLLELERHATNVAELDLRSADDLGVQLRVAQST
jgi:hypothetical protein